MPNAFLNKLINNSKVDHTLYKKTIDSNKSSTYIKGEGNTFLQLKHNKLHTFTSSFRMEALSYSSLQDCVDGNYDQNVSNIFYSSVSTNTLTTKIVNKCYNNAYNDMYEQDKDGAKKFYGIDRNKLTEFGQSQTIIDSYKLMSGNKVNSYLIFTLNSCEEPLLIQPLRQMDNTNITPVIYGTNDTMTSSGFVPYSVKGNNLDNSRNMWLDSSSLSSEKLGLRMDKMIPSTFIYKFKTSTGQAIRTFWMANDVWHASGTGYINERYAFLKPSFFSRRYYKLDSDQLSTKVNSPYISLDSKLLSDRTSTAGSIFCHKMKNFYPTSDYVNSTSYNESTSKYESLLAMANYDNMGTANLNTKHVGILNRMDNTDNAFYANMYDFLNDNCDRRRHSKYNANRLIYTSYKQPIQTTRLITYKKGYERNPRLGIAYGTSSSDSYSIYEPDKVLPELASFYIKGTAPSLNSTTITNETTVNTTGTYDLQVQTTRINSGFLTSLNSSSGADFSNVTSSDNYYYYIKKLIDYYGHNFVTNEISKSIYKRKKFFDMYFTDYALSTYIYSDVTQVLPGYTNHKTIYLKTRNTITMRFSRNIENYVPVCNDQRLYEMIKNNGYNLLPLFTRKKVYNRKYSNDVNGEQVEDITSYDLKSGGRLMDFHYVRPDLLYKLNTYGYLNASKLAYTYNFE